MDAALLWALAFHDATVRTKLREPASALGNVQGVIANELNSRTAQDEGGGWAQPALSPAARGALVEAAATLNTVQRVVAGEAPASLTATAETEADVEAPVRPSRLFEQHEGALAQELEGSWV